VVRKQSNSPLDHEHFALDLYLSDGVGVEVIFVEGDVTSRQRAGKSAEQSATGSSDQVIERRGIRRLRIRGDAVFLGHFVVDPEQHRFLLGGKMSPPGFPSTGSIFTREM
jgi:hypothetical protein